MKSKRLVRGTQMAQDLFETSSSGDLFVRTSSGTKLCLVGLGDEQFEPLQVHADMTGTTVQRLAWEALADYLEVVVTTGVESVMEGNGEA